jgi:hypothetical protein
MRRSGLRAAVGDARAPTSPTRHQEVTEAGAVLFDPRQAVGTVVGVDGFAKQFTHWPDAEAAFDISPAHPSASAASECFS